MCGIDRSECLVREREFVPMFNYWPIDPRAAHRLRFRRDFCATIAERRAETT